MRSSCVKMSRMNIHTHERERERKPMFNKIKKRKEERIEMVLCMKGSLRKEHTANEILCDTCVCV